MSKIQDKVVSFCVLWYKKLWLQPTIVSLPANDYALQTQHIWLVWLSTLNKKLFRLYTKKNFWEKYPRNKKLVRFYKMDFDEKQSSFLLNSDVLQIRWSSRRCCCGQLNCPRTICFGPQSRTLRSNEQWLIWAEQGERQTGLANNYFLLRRAPGLGLSRCEIFDDHGDYLD